MSWRTAIQASISTTFPTRTNNWQNKLSHESFPTQAHYPKTKGLQHLQPLPFVIWNCHNHQYHHHCWDLSPLFLDPVQISLALHLTERAAPLATTISANSIAGLPRLIFICHFRLLACIQILMHCHFRPKYWYEKYCSSKFECLNFFQCQGQNPCQNSQFQPKVFFFDKDTVIVDDKLMTNFLFVFVVSCIIITRNNYVLSYKATELIES